MVHSSKKPPLPELRFSAWTKSFATPGRSPFATQRQMMSSAESIQQRKKGFLEENENIFKFFILAALT
jgi:hypothetical protein